MTWIISALSKELRRGHITVDIPGFQMEEFLQSLHGQAEETLRDASYIVFNDELNDTEKVNQLAKLLL